MATNPTNSNTTALEGLSKALKDAAKKVTGGVANFLNPVNRFVSVMKKSEELQLKSLAVGTTYAKFTAANTKALEGTMATQQEMTDFLVTGFSRGLRGASDSTIKLADEMILTGQNTTGLISAMATLRSTTNNSSKVGGMLSKSILKNSKDYGATAETMIDALNSVKSSLEMAAIHGDKAVGAYSEFTTDMVAAMGGSEDAKKNVQTFLTMAGALEVQKQALFGITDEMKSLRKGNNISNIILEKLVAFDEKLGKGQIRRESMINQIGKKESLAALGMLRALQKQNELSAEEKKTQQDNLESIASKKRIVDRFYEQLAPDQYNLLLTYLPAIATGVATGGIIGMIGKLGKVASFLHPIGAALTVVTAAVPLVTRLLSDTEDNTKDTNKILKRSKDKEVDSGFKATTLAQAAALASGLLGSSSPKKTERVEKLLKAILEKTPTALEIAAAMPEPNQQDGTN